MPVRQDVQGGISTPTPQGYQSPGAARAQFQGVDLSGLQDAQNRQSAFWAGLAKRGIAAGETFQEKEKARAYLEGQQDSEMGKVRSDVHGYSQGDYEQGYNRAQIGTDLSKYQLSIQSDAVEFVNSGKTPDDFRKHVEEKTNELLDTAGSQGMNLNDKDWQAWLTGVQSTRDTAADVYNTKSLERSQYMKTQAIAAESNASIATFMAADEAGNPIQALGNITSHLTRVYSDPTLSVQQKDGILADYAANIMTAAKSSGAVEAVSSYFQARPEFQALPTQVQTQILRGAQSSYDQRATDEVGATYSYISQVRAVQSTTELESQYPMSTFIDTINQAQRERKLSPGQAYNMIEEENTRRLKLQKVSTLNQAMLTGTTLSDISTTTGLTMGKTQTALTQVYAQKFGGYSGGGAALVQRGLQSGAQDITALGITMLQQDAQSLNNLDPRQLKRDADGNAQYPATVVNSLTNLKQAYDAAQQAGNNAQAAQLVAGLPDAVGYGIRQASDARSVADVVYGRANDIAAGRVVQLPAKMPNEMLTTTSDLTAGLFDTSLTQRGARRNILGVQSYIFTSAADEKLAQSRLSQVNGAIGEEYTAAYQQGILPAYEGEDLKNWLVGRVASRTVRVDDGTDAGTLMILPRVANPQATFGSTDNNILGQSFKPFVDAFKSRNPGAVSVQMQFDPMSNEVVFSGIDKDNIRLTTQESVSAAEIRDSSKAVEVRATNGGNGGTLGSLAVPGVGMLKFNSGNQFGVEPQVYSQAVTQLVSYEGYTDQKGFSVLGTHPTTGAPLNDEKYVKQPGDTPQMAANKFSMYLTDKVMPQVMDEMSKFSGMPEFLRQQVFGQLVDTTYHAGNAAAFGDILEQAYKGDTAGAYKAFRESALYRDAGADSRRNRDRLRTLDAVSQFSRTQRNGY